MPLAALVAAIAAASPASPACGSVETRTPDGGGPGGDGDQDDGQGTDGDAGDPTACEPGGDPSFDEGWACARDAFCRGLDRCFAAFDLEDCRRMGMGASMFGEADPVLIERLREAVNQGTVLYHPDAVAECMRAPETASCAARAASGQPFRDRCPIFSGAVADGDPCFTDLECQTPGAVCRGAAECAAGELCCQRTCIPPATLLNACGDPGGDCADGLHCIAGVCRDGEVGSPCAFGSDCDPEYWCDTVAGTCQRDTAPGAPCVADEQCPPPESCLGDDLTDPAGATCGRSDRAGDGCDFPCYGAHCLQPAAGELGTCVEPPGGGDSCAQVVCFSPFACSAEDVCVALGEIGAACTRTEGQCRIGLVCDAEIDGAPEGECVAPRPAEAPCMEGGHCASGICDAVALTCEDFPGCYD